MINADDYRSVLGVDGCPAGWISFQLDMHSKVTTTRVVARMDELIRDIQHPALVAIDIPIGLPKGGPRSCDVMARTLLGKTRSSSVFPTPVRSTLDATSYEEACGLSRMAQGKSLSRQAFALLGKIREVDNLITPDVQRWLFEVHPELCFWALNGNQAMRHKKSTKLGKEERLELLISHFPMIPGHLAELAPGMAAPHDLLDAAVAAWTAERVATGKQSRQFDARGLRMEIVY